MNLVIKFINSATVDNYEGFKSLLTVKNIFDGKSSSEVKSWPYYLTTQFTILSYCTPVDVDRKFSP